MVVRLHIGGGGGGLLHRAQDLGVERRRTHLVVYLAPLALPVAPPSLHLVVHYHLQGDGLGLGGGRGDSVLGRTDRKTWCDRFSLREGE